MYDLLIVGGTVVTATGAEACDVAVDGETIAAVAPAGSLGADARKVIDAAGCYVIPGGIDPARPLRDGLREHHPHRGAAATRLPRRSAATRA